ncbi:hypothetical protein KE423_003897 [Salmonella enterica]|nr:hypothetical protein [Salmonella enterica]
MIEELEQAEQNLIAAYAKQHSISLATARQAIRQAQQRNEQRRKVYTGPPDNGTAYQWQPKRPFRQ